MFFRPKPDKNKKFAKNMMSIELKPLRNSHDLHPLRSNLTLDNSAGSKGSFVSSSILMTDALNS